MATLTPGQKVLGSLLAQPGFVEHMLSKTRPELEDDSYRRARESNDGTDYDFSDVLKNIPKGPQPGTDPLTGMPIDSVQGQSGPNVASAKDFLQRAGEKVGDFLQFVHGSEEDPKTLDGASMPGGMDPNLFNAPADYQRRYRESMQGGDPTSGGYF